ncbi:hypothetical protein ON010_g4718 [Phytophthora cinnamomi]|nr:hypothetical protein ON010_g4718 [Phytophthora cinnamomi]
MEQISIVVPGLHMTSVQRLVPSIVAPLAAAVYRVMASSLIGFPLPFSILFGMPVWLVAFVICFMGFFGRILNRDRALLQELIKANTVLNCQMLLTFIYPIYFYGLQAIGKSSQLYYVMLLPIIKILAKNLISAALGTKYDLLPQIMIFNVDVFNGLSVSNSIQNSTSNSITTTLAMVMLDAAQGLISISDISAVMKHIVLLRRKIPDDHKLKSACFVDIALQIIKEDGQSQMTVAPADHSLRPNEDSTGQTSSLMGVFSPNEKKRFLHKTAQVLFTTEFVILVKYAEVVIPLIYCAYTCISTASMFFLPNRSYYPQLKSLDEAELRQKINAVLRCINYVSDPKDVVHSLDG